MGVAQVPAASGSAIKTVQRGSAAGAGTVTITAVDINKSFVTVFGTASSGTVSASFNLSAAANGTIALEGPAVSFANNNVSVNTGHYPNSANLVTDSQVGMSNTGYSWTKNVTSNAFNYNVGAGSNNLVSAVVQGYLSGSTSLVVSGACRWEVVEFN